MPLSLARGHEWRDATRHRAVEDLLLDVPPLANGREGDVEVVAGLGEGRPTEPFLGAVGHLKREALDAGGGVLIAQAADVFEAVVDEP